MNRKNLNPSKRSFIWVFGISHALGLFYKFVRAPTQAKAREKVEKWIEESDPSNLQITSCKQIKDLEEVLSIEGMTIE